jgi:MFS transporter, DHA1 family, multidrug resistance protein
VAGSRREGRPPEQQPSYRAKDDLESTFVPAEEMVEPTTAALELGEATFSRTPRSWSFVLVLGGSAALAPFAIDMYLPALPVIADDLGGSASGVQLSLTACLAGLAGGQLVAGPLSDRYGRRVPLVIGLLGFVAASLLCGLATSVPMLVLLRLLQGLFGAAPQVVGRAVVRDLYDGAEAVRFFSLLMLVIGLAPIIAPVVGVQVLRFADWRMIFVVLAIIGAVVTAAALVLLPETHPAGRRQPTSLWGTVRGLLSLLSDRVLVGYALASGLAFAAMFAYISGSPFVVQNVYGGSPFTFSLIFGANALGLTLASQVNGRLAGRVAARSMLTGGLGVTFLAGLAILGVVLSGIPHLAALVVPLFVLISSLGFVMPNATALALSRHPEAAGSASALLGVLQFIVGAVAAPLVGLGGPNTAFPMALVIALLSAGAVAALLTLTDARRVAA